MQGLARRGQFAIIDFRHGVALSGVAGLGEAWALRNHRFGHGVVRRREAV